METNKTLILLTGLFMVIFCAAATTQHGSENVADSSLFRELSAIDSESLISEAENYIILDTLFDRATMALTIVTNRYYENPKDSAIRHHAAKAFTSLGNFYHVEPIDFKKAYKYLRTALQIAEEDKDYQQLSLIYLSLANLYHNSDINKTMPVKAREFFIKGMDAAIRSDSPDAISIIALGMVTAAFNEGT